MELVIIINQTQGPFMNAVEFIILILTSEHPDQWKMTELALCF